MTERRDLPASEDISKKDIGELIASIKKDTKINWEDLASLEELGKRFQSEKSEILKWIKDDLKAAKIEMLTKWGFAVHNEKDYKAFVMVAKICGLWENFPAYQQLSDAAIKSHASWKWAFTLYLESGKIWAYNYDTTLYFGHFENQQMSVGPENMLVSSTNFKNMWRNSGWGSWDSRVFSHSRNDFTVPGTVDTKLAAYNKEQIQGHCTTLNECIAKLEQSPVEPELSELRGKAKIAYEALKGLNYTDIARYLPKLSLIDGAQAAELEQGDTWDISTQLKNKGTFKLSDKTKWILTGDIADAEKPTMAELKAILSKYAQNLNLYNGKDKSITPNDHIKITYAVQIALNHIMGGDLQIDWARWAKSIQAIKDFQKSVDFKETNPDDPTKKVDGVPGAATITKILEKLGSQTPVA